MTAQPFSDDPQPIKALEVIARRWLRERGSIPLLPSK